jgi:hypothetical protein
VGTVLGDMSQRTVGVEPDPPGASPGAAPPSLRFSDAVFRLCPRFNYRHAPEPSVREKRVQGEGVCAWAI